jgi:hypothetical protein
VRSKQTIAAEKRFKSSVACATLDARRRARRSAFKSCRGACNAAAAFDMSEADQADGGIVIKNKRFVFETCEEIQLNYSSVRLLSHHDVARRAMRPAPAARILASRR